MLGKIEMIMKLTHCSLSGKGVLKSSTFLEQLGHQMRRFNVIFETILKKEH